jgi:hypothetical protein
MDFKQWSDVSFLRLASPALIENPDPCARSLSYGPHCIANRAIND